MSVDSHPTEYLLGEFLLGKVSDAEQAELESHLTGCPVCQQLAAAQHRSDTFIDLLAAASTRADDDGASSATPSLSAAGHPTQTWHAATPLAGRADLPPVLASHPRYRPVRLIGNGGMGSVWLARHTVMNRDVAVKVIRPDHTTHPQAAARFVREIRAAARLDHENIVRAYDAEEIGGACLLAMEFVLGRNLADELEIGVLPPAEACQAARDAARGLAHAHAAGFIHRDVKPGNLIRTPSGVTKVLDFGLVTCLTDGPSPHSAGNVVIGTPSYIAPEQIADARTSDARSDVYSLGCTLYHLLSGRVPYPADSTIRRLDAHRDPAQFPDPIPGLSASLGAVLAKMLAKNPADRYQTATDVAEALEPFAAGVQPNAVPRRPVRNWLVAFGLLFGTLALAAGGVLYKIQRDNEVITVETDDPDIEVVMKRNGELVRIVDAKTKKSWELDTKKMRLTPDGGELSIDMPGKEPFVIRRNGDAAVTIRRQPKVPAKLGPIPPVAAATVVEELHRIPFTFAGWHDFSADGKEFLAFEPKDGNRVAVLFSTATGKETGRFPVPAGNLVGVWFIPGSHDLLVSVDHKVSRWDRTTHKKMKDLMTLPPAREDGTFMVPLADGGVVGVATWGAFGPGRHGVFVFDLKSGKERFRVKPLHAGTILGMSPRLSLDGKYLATTDTTPTSSTIRIWETSTGEMFKSIDVGGALTATIEFSRGNEVIANYTSADGRLLTGNWNVATGKPFGKTPTLHAESGGATFWLPGGDQLVLYPPGAKSARFHDTRTGDLLGVYEPGETIASAVASADGRFVLFVTDTGLRIVRSPPVSPKRK